MSKTPKFDAVLEQLTRVYQMGGLLIGKYVKIKKDALNHPMIKDKPESFKKQIELMMKDSLPIKASYVNTQRPVSSGIGGVETSGGDIIMVDVVTEYAPGLWTNPVTLPLDVIEPLDDVYGDSETWHRKDNTTLKPEKAEIKDKKELHIKQTGVADGDKSLPTKDAGEVKIDTSKDVKKESIDYDRDFLKEAFNKVLEPKS